MIQLIVIIYSMLGYKDSCNDSWNGCQWNM